MNRSIDITFYKLNEQAKVPVKSTEFSACFDVYSNFFDKKEFSMNNGEYKEPVRKDKHGKKYVIMRPGERVLVPTGLVVLMPPTVNCKVYSRSGMAWKQGLIVLNAPGIIDPDYTNELFVMLYNSSENIINLYDDVRIAQIEFDFIRNVIIESSVDPDEFVKFKKLVEKISKRRGGIGSTGIK